MPYYMALQELFAIKNGRQLGKTWLANCHVIWQNGSMKNASIAEILPLIDASVLGDLDVKERSLRLVRERGVFPSSWYTILKSVCDAEGVECPVSMFNFKSPSPNASNRATDQ